MDRLKNINNKKYLIFLLLLLSYCTPNYAMINIVAAENVYGSVSQQLGGPYVKVVNILASPSQDPHLFNINLSIAKAVRNADITIINGANYDPWIYPLLQAKDNNSSIILVVAELVKPPNIEDPHLWYLPSTMRIFAQKLVKILIAKDPAHRVFYEERLIKFYQEYQPLDKLIQSIKNNYAGKAVIATEPFFNYMAAYLGLKMHGKVFQLSMMNDLPPPISEIKRFEDDLRHHCVQLLIYNKQVMSPTSKRMLSIAQEENIPVVGMSELLPNNLTYVTWMLQQLELVANALKKT